VLPAGTPILNWGCPDRGGDSVPEELHEMP